MTSLNDINFNNKKALVRVDFNVPLNDALEVTDITRIQAAKPTLIKILEDGGSAIIVSHLGRPKAKEEQSVIFNVSNNDLNISLGLFPKIIGIIVKFFFS